MHRRPHTGNAGLSPARTAARRIGAGLCLILLLAAGAAPAAAQPSPALDRLAVLLGAYYSDNGTILHAQTPDGSLGGTLDLERDLGFRPRVWLPRGRIDLLIGDTQGLSFDYYRYQRRITAPLQRTFTYENTTYDASALIRSALRFDFGSAAYRWWLGSGNDVVGIGLGAGYYRIDASLSGQATVAGLSGYAQTSTRADAWAPLLQLGWRHALGKHWRLYLDASGVKKNGGPLYGHIYNASLGMQWFPVRRFGLSLEYDVNRIRLYQHRDRYRDRLNLTLNGPSLFATFRL
jgi:hypothetical protein